MPTLNAPLFGWGSPVEVERRRRIRLCLMAYSYEVIGAPIATDQQFDDLAQTSVVELITGRHDDWWQESFQPYTGQWIHGHPDLNGIARLHEKLKHA